MSDSAPSALAESHRSAGQFPIVPPQNRWDAGHASTLKGPLELLAYRSNLLGADRSVANWGGGNTSSKCIELDFRERPTRVLWVKGSGSDLASIRPAQFTGLRMEDVLPLLERDAVSDEDLVAYYEHAVLRPGQPRASIETPLHSMLPFEYVDHTHPDAIIALCAAPEGRRLAERLWDGRAIWVDYERPGFSLGKKIALAVRDRPDAACVLMAKHGLVTWADSGEECYARSIEAIARAAEALAEHVDRRRVFAVTSTPAPGRAMLASALPALRGAVSRRRPMVLHLDTSDRARAFADRPDVAEVSGAGPACPDHLVHTKPWPLVVSPAHDAASLARHFVEGVAAYEDRYSAYVARHDAQVVQRDPAPRVVLVPGIGVITTGPDALQASVASALYERAIAVLSTTVGLGGFAPLTESETFGVEYWPMELYKLSLLPAPRELAGQVALVTGAASGIGRAIARRLAEAGAHVVIADRNAAGAADVANQLAERHGERRALAVAIDVGDESAVSAAFSEAVLAYGGVDVVVSNAGISTSHPVEDTSLDEWNLNLSVLGTGYFLVAREAFRVLRAQGRGGSVVFVASKNGLVGGRNASAYSSAKALEIHLARCLAEEGGGAGIRINTVNPDAVLQDSGIWTSAWREQRASTYGIAPDQLEAHYRARTTLKVNVYAEDIAEAVLFFASSRSAKSTGNILNVDGGVPAAYAR
ncbi:MAG: bifunctional rhamnulose-1-phosphate aldolase/short-chain dehydrogenase [Chloroflexi bacterium]|nr:bifunctional rhamnulose-1-phosphate aldolase/short-chain dehydrogenase [Chloroflexota bacterium]